MAIVREILVVEDDLVIGSTLVLDLRKEGYRATHSKSVAEASSALGDHDFDLVILDLNLPDGSGLSVCSLIQEEHSGTPVMVLTAQTDEETALRSLNRGAIDFIRKPFGRRELLLRISRVLKGRGGNISQGEVEIRLDEMRVLVQGSELKVTKTEFGLLHLLMENFDEVVSRERLLVRIREDGDLFDSALNVHLSRLRKKLKDAGMNEIVLSSIYGKGYRLEKA